MIFKLQSLNDVVTNSSMEVYQEATQYTRNMRVKSSILESAVELK